MVPKSMEQRVLLSRRSFLGLSGAAFALAGCANTGTSPVAGSEAIHALEAGDGVRSMDAVLSSGTVRVGMVPDSLPLCFIDGTGNYNGFEKSLVSYPIGAVGLGVEVVPLDYGEVYDSLANGRIDIACCAASPADERASEAAYSFPYIQLQLGVLSAASEPLSSMDELEGRVLLACEGSYAAAWMQSNLPSVELRTYETYTNLYQALQTGFGDAIIADELVLQGWATKNAGYAVGIRALGEPRQICLAAAAQNGDLLDYLKHELRNYIVYSHMWEAYVEFVAGNVGDGYVGMLLEPPEGA